MHTAKDSIEIDCVSPAMDADVQTIVKSRVIARSLQVCHLDREVPWLVNVIKAVKIQLEHILDGASAQWVLVPPMMQKKPSRSPCWIAA